MTLQDYYKGIGELLEERPELKDAKVVYASDGEGNDYDTVHYSPSAGFYKNREFISEAQFEEREEDEDHETKYKANSVCVN